MTIQRPKRHDPVSERGSAAVELVMLVVPIMVLVAFTVFVGRWSATHQDVVSAARDAARAAAVRQDPGDAQQAAQQAAADTLAYRELSCVGGPSVAADVADLVPGGHVTVTVACVVDMSDMSGFGIPGTRTATATATVVVDVYRGES